MKSFFIFAFLVIACAISSAQTTASQPSDPAAQELIAKSKSVLEAMKSKDLSALNGLLATNFRSIDVAGGLSSREEMIGAAHEGFLKDFFFYDPQAMRINDDSILVTYNTATSLSDAIQKEMDADRITFPRYCKVADLWVRQGGDWKLQFEQLTPVQAMY